ncbi:MAG: NAD-glutamate dehydrogenase, partial [Simkaniaceae bacterium]|nr:NAD-glutamate dehydrogenase [Simkaniaceae bacterium]
MTEMSSRLSKEELALAKSRESELFEKYYKWLDKNMTPSFFEEVSQEQLMLIVHNLMGLELSKYFAKIEMSDCAIVLSKNAPDADVRVLHEYQLHGIKNYVAFMSKDPPPIAGMEEKLRISIVQFTKFDRPDEGSEQILSWDEMKEIFNETSKRNSEISFDEFNSLFRSMNDRFIRSMTKERLALALDMFFRAKTRDNCQYEIIYNKDWKKHKSFVPSVQIVFAWRNTPKYRFLFRLAELFFRHKLKMSRVNATYITPYEKNNILMMSIGITGTSGKAAWDEADMDDFLKELVTLKYFEDRDRIQETFVKPGLVRGNIGNFLRTASTFAHQALVHVDSNLYTLENVEEALCRHPELSVEICNAFEQKFNPKKPNIKEYEKSKKRIFKRIQELDTGHEVNDARRKNVLSAALNFVEYTLKTNFYRNNKSALSYRIDPQYLDHIPFNRREKFPELPYGIFFVQGMNFIGFQIRFKDLARGGLRTVLPKEMEDLAVNRDSIFSECYNLSYTQQKKNKDIPEGGSKAIILLEPYKRLDFETDIYATELKGAEYTSECIEEVIACYRKDRKDQYLYHAQRSFVHSLMTLINCDDKGKLRYKDIVDYYDYPEFIYLGPDENMHNEMIEWIAAFSLSVGYKLGTAFISSKPKAGVNHKQFGVTSLGVHVCMDEALLYLDIDPKHEPFTVKITGGPDGDVAGNMILNLHKHYPKTAKLIALIDGSGTIRDPNGLDLDVLTALFRDGKPINNYPPEKLGDGAFLLDNWSKKQQSSYKQATLLWKKEKGELKQEWISGNKANHLLRMNVHETPADVFIPAGG